MAEAGRRAALACVMHAPGCPHCAPTHPPTHPWRSPPTSTQSLAGGDCAIGWLRNPRFRIKFQFQTPHTTCVLRLQEYQAAALQSFLAHLQPAACCAFLSDKSLAGGGPGLQQQPAQPLLRERWYGAQYSVQPLPLDLLLLGTGTQGSEAAAADAAADASPSPIALHATNGDRAAGPGHAAAAPSSSGPGVGGRSSWAPGPELAALEAQLRLPPKRTWALPIGSSLVAEGQGDAEAGNAPAPPLLLKDTGAVRLWHRLDTSYGVPKVRAVVCVRLASKTTKGAMGLGVVWWAGVPHGRSLRGRGWGGQGRPSLQHVAEAAGMPHACMCCAGHSRHTALPSPSHVSVPLSRARAAPDGLHTLGGPQGMHACPRALVPRSPSHPCSCRPHPTCNRAHGPQAHVFVHIATADVYRSPASWVAARLAVRVLDELLQPAAYPAQLLGTSYGLSCSETGLHLALHGFSSVLPRLAGVVLDALAGVTREQVEAK